jgi:hypothetical protein
MPRETNEFRERMDVWHPAYPTMEYGGLVFVYMGPPGTEPLFPMYASLAEARLSPSDCRRRLAAQRDSVVADDIDAHEWVLLIDPPAVPP